MRTPAITPVITLVFLLTGPALAIDLENGQDINDVCAGCHGEFGQGGGDSEYPRLAGMPAEFIAKQLHLFRDRSRPNMAMVEYIDERQMPDEDIRDVSHYLAGITLKTKLPPVDENAPDFDAYARLKASKQLMQIPRAEGDVERGEQLYRKECGSCHGDQGWGDNEKAVPQLAGQFTDYLWRQVEKYRNKVRIHDETDPDYELLNDFRDDQLKDIFAYLSIVDD
ncbi:c-type cytochrome [Magnetovirga frankeli]|uniref:c-type cytochrome n=1 Tax=Magnetovirga frankeli TaxID=947516 RepID=UPI001292F65B|nr:c-type cytochrome [gamma proteobacterium SS-5]